MSQSETNAFFQLDTNILVHAVRGSTTWQKIKQVCDPLVVDPRPSICVVTEGELRSFALRRGWNDLKTEQAEFLLGYFHKAGIDSPEVMQAYARIDTYSFQNGINMGKNDLWIAATAFVMGAILVTTDRDFEHLHGVFLDRLLIPLN